MKPKKAIGMGWIDRAAMLFGRPWIFMLAIGFILIPSQFLIAGLNSGAAFLKIGTGARPTAMGGAYTALSTDINALYYNPGALSRLTQKELGATHTEWLLGTTFDFVGYAHPTANGTFGVGLTRLGTGKIEGRSAAASFEASDTAYTVGYSRGVGDVLLGNLSLGGNIKYLQSSIAGYSAQTVAFDLGAQHQIDGRPLSLGFSVLNIGKGMKFLDQTDPLPLTFAAGAAYRFAGTLQVAFDVRHEVHDNRTDIGIGSEYALVKNFTLRAGYASSVANAAGGGGAVGGLTGLGGGFGLKIGKYRADYTFTPFGALGNAQRISLGARF